MTDSEVADRLVRLLRGFSGGSAQVQVNSIPFASIDAQARTLDLQIAPLLSGRRELRSALRAEGPSRLWAARKFPSELARQGWRVTLSDGAQELAAFGRGTSALGGHVHLSPIALWKLRKLV